MSALFGHAHKLKKFFGGGSLKLPALAPHEISTSRPEYRETLLEPFSPSRPVENDFQSNAPSADYSTYKATSGSSRTDHLENAKQAKEPKGLRIIDTNVVPSFGLSKPIQTAVIDNHTYEPNEFDPYPENNLPPSWSNNNFQHLLSRSSSGHLHSQQHSTGGFDFSSVGVQDPSHLVSLNYVAGSSGVDPLNFMHHLSETAGNTLEQFSQSNQYLSGDSSSSTLSFGGSLLDPEDDEKDDLWPMLPQSYSALGIYPMDLIDLTGDTDENTDRIQSSSSGPCVSLGSSFSNDFFDSSGVLESQRPLTRGLINQLTDISKESQPLCQTDEVQSSSEASDVKPEHDSDFGDLEDLPSSDESVFPSPPRRKRGKRAPKAPAPNKRAKVARAEEPEAPKKSTSRPNNKASRGRRIPVIPKDEIPVHLGTPVLDAHRGISINDLRGKADRFRDRNPGMNLDSRWLASFAGKLTPFGELIEEYRCYVDGCIQTNKRRDHILIHISGQHLEERPFACAHCSTTFLRKNECKRHEFSHSGERPYACTLCPKGKTAFVRQDLLRRHQARKHGVKREPSS